MIFDRFLQLPYRCARKQHANGCHLSDLLRDLHGALVVSCQADPGSPLADPSHIVAIAAAVVAGGARAVRIEGFTNISAVKARIAVPVIGLVKSPRAGSEVYITPALEDIDEVAGAGADIIAFDGTARPRPVTVGALVDAVHRQGRIAMADISTVEEARSALAAGADVVGTTMAGYTSYSRGDPGPDFGLMQALQRVSIPFIAEGRIWTLDDALRCLELGANFVVVGSAITRPTMIAEHFSKGIAARHKATHARGAQS